MPRNRPQSIWPNLWAALPAIGSLQSYAHFDFERRAAWSATSSTTRERLTINIQPVYAAPLDHIWWASGGTSDAVVRWWQSHSGPYDNVNSVYVHYLQQCFSWAWHISMLCYALNVAPLAVDGGTFEQLQNAQAVFTAVLLRQSRRLGNRSLTGQFLATAPFDTAEAQNELLESYLVVHNALLALRPVSAYNFADYTVYIQEVDRRVALVCQQVITGVHQSSAQGALQVALAPQLDPSHQQQLNTANASDTTHPLWKRMDPSRVCPWGPDSGYRATVEQVSAWQAGGSVYGSQVAPSLPRSNVAPDSQQ